MPRGHERAAAGIHAEVEAKLYVPDERTLRGIGRLTQLGAYRLHRRRTVRLCSVYLDTSKFVLARAGVALRVRRQGRHWEATAKWASRVIGDIHDRPELSVPLTRVPRMPFALPVGALRDQLGALIAGRPLRPILNTEIRRNRFDIWRPGRPRPLAELALDRVHLSAPGRNGLDISYCEVEIERIHGTRRDLRALSSALRRMFHLVPSADSKFSRGVKLLYGPGVLRAD